MPWFASVSHRVDRRPEPRLSVALAAAGCVLGVIGVLVIASDPLVDTDGGDPNRIPGIVASLLLVAVGLVVVRLTCDGPLATAGVVASALGVAPLVFFATFDQNDFPPFDVDLILGVSAVTWLVLYVVPPSRGHSFYLGAGLLGLWLYLLEAVEGLFSSPFDVFSAFAFGFSPGFESSDPTDLLEPSPFPPTDDPFTSFDPPDPTTLGILSLAVAGVFLAAAVILDRRGRRGMATPFVLAGIVIAPAAILILADDLNELGTGLAFALLGVAFGAGGAITGRRWTTWFGGALVVQGLAVLAAELAGDDASATEVGIILMVFGLIAVGGGIAVSRLLGEPDETVDGPSRFGRPRPSPMPGLPPTTGGPPAPGQGAAPWPTAPPPAPPAPPPPRPGAGADPTPF